jgi:hypothetical protein
MVPVRRILGLALKTDQKKNGDAHVVKLDGTPALT